MGFFLGKNMKMILIVLCSLFVTSAFSTGNGFIGGDKWSEGKEDSVTIDANVDKVAMMKIDTDNVRYNITADYDIDEARLVASTRDFCKIETRSNSKDGYRIQVGPSSTFKLSDGNMEIHYRLSADRGVGSSSAVILSGSQASHPNDVLFDLSPNGTALDNSRSDIQIRLHIQDSPGLLSQGEDFVGTIVLAIAAK